MNRAVRIVFWWCCVGSVGATTAEPVIAPEQLQFFETKIRPVLVRECYGCHSNATGNAKGGLRLDTRELTHIGGDSGPAVVPGDVDGSLLVAAIAHEGIAMPPKRQLSESVVNDFRRWVEMGAPDPRVTATAPVQSSVSLDDITAMRRSHWSLQPPTASVPTTEDEWSITDIDRFVWQKLHDAALQPAIDATAPQVARRLCFDLIGLPPTLEQLSAFEESWAVDPDQAIAALADELLAQPGFGERWGRHWLDVVRFAESNGREVNVTFPHAWRYRDYVIDAFNADKPYDEFVRQQLAGDVLPASSDDHWTENLIATAFLALGPKTLSEQNGAQFANDLIDEQIDITSRVFLGISVACARCHDHKFEPIAQSDYAAMAGLFASTATYYGTPASSFGNAAGLQNRNNTNLIRLPVDDPNPFDRSIEPAELAALTQQARDARASLVEAQMARRRGDDSGTSQAAIQQLVRTQTTIAAVSSMIGGVDSNGKPISYCMGTQEATEPRDMPVYVRGEIDQPADVVPRGIPRMLCEENPSIGSRESGRLQLAHFIADENNPLTARVMVNRIWQHLIGRGLIETVDDLGSTGSTPSHPELLDHLAIQFVQSGWSTKTLIREIVTSRVYRSSSRYRSDAFNVDPDNRLLWRANPRRLEAEAIRDAMLQVAGRLDANRPRASEVARAGYTQVRDGNLINVGQFITAASMGGNPRDAMRSAYARQSSTGGDADRLDMLDAEYRSVYLPVVRDQIPRCLEVFDFAEPSLIVGIRETSNTADQALYLMNNPLVTQSSQRLAQRVLRQPGDVESRIDTAFRIVFSRSPTPDETSTVLRGLERFNDRSSLAMSSPKAWTKVCQALLAAAEFRYLD